MDKGVTFLICVICVALSQVSITNADWRGNVCSMTKVVYVKKPYCTSYLLWTCNGYKTGVMPTTSYYQSCCSGWSHNGDQNCNIPICLPVCQNGATCVAPNKCECTQDQSELYKASTMDGPDNITFIPDKAIIHEFGALNITCLANCYTFCSFKWIKHGNSDIQEKMVVASATLQIPNATRKDAGNYSCWAMNNVTNTTVMDSVTLEVIYDDDLGQNSSSDKDEASDTMWIPILVNVLAGTALVLACFICGILVYESQKRCYKKSSNISTAADLGPSDIDLANSMKFDTDTHPCTDNWTMENDSTGGHHARIDYANAQIYDHPLAIKQNLP